MNESKGLTLIETVVAIAICAIVLAALASVSTAGLRESRQGNFKAQATQVLDTIGRRIAGGQDSTLLLASGEELQLSGEEVDEIMSLDAFGNGAFEVRVENLGRHRVANTVLYRYQVEVCYDANVSDRCVSGLTLSRQE